MPTTTDDAVKDAALRYEAARLAFRSLSDDMAVRLAAGERLTDEQTGNGAEAFAAVVTARRAMMTAFQSAQAERMPARAVKDSLRRDTFDRLSGNAALR